MKTRAELKAMAKAQIKGNIGILFLITLIIYGITAFANLIPGAGLLVTLIVTPAFTISLWRIHLNLTYGKKPDVKDSFAGFDDFWTAFKVNFLVGLFTWLWSLLFLIPGIIKAISYSQAIMIAAENPGISAMEAIERSKAMMEGKKWRYFVLSLSFIGWLLLVPLTFGILSVWLVPYMNATMANFYQSIKPVGQAPFVQDAPPQVHFQTPPQPPAF